MRMTCCKVAHEWHTEWRSVTLRGAVNTSKQAVTRTDAVSRGGAMGRCSSMNSPLAAYLDIRECAAAFARVRRGLR